MMKFRENEDAVSPVIGVILMVAITVILAAVIAAFVFGMGSNVQGTKTVGLSLQKDGTALKVTITGGPDLPTLQHLKVTIDNANNFTQSSSFDMGPTQGTKRAADSEFKVGDTFKLSDALDEKGYKRVIVVGHFSDGQDQMLLDKQL